MVNLLRHFLPIALCSFFSVSICAAELPLAFPGADGFGRNTTGGRGGKVLYVTHLNDDQSEGSLRWAIGQKYPRIVMFKVSGTIALNAPLEIKNGDLTLAGQVAPGDGVCIKNHSVVVKASNVIIRYMRFRMGDEHRDQSDALQGQRQRNVIIDHCSMSWSTDECASFYDNQDFTMQWCILSESLRRSVHAKGAHGYGGIWGGMKASFHHNLLAHHSSRNPRFCGARYHESTKETELADFRNNVIYNWGYNSSYAGENGQYNLVNNYYKPGPATAKKVRHRIMEVWQSKDGRGFHDFGKFYIAGNVVEGNAAVTKNNWDGGVDYKLYLEKEEEDKASPQTDSLLLRVRSEQPFEYVMSTNHTAQQAYDAVLQHAGAGLVRDAIDARIVDEVRRGTYTYGNLGMIDSQTDVGGWPAYNSSIAPIDTDDDGMPDAWETAHKLNKNDATDGKRYSLSKEYTNVEVYMNSLVE